MSTQDVVTVFIVDDDRDVRESLQELLESVGLPSKSFGTAKEFLSSPRSDGPSCLILDVRLPGISGLDLQHELKKGKVSIPIIFLTAHADVPMSVKAMKSGAVEFHQTIQAPGFARCGSAIAHSRSHRPRKAARHC